MVLTRKSLWTWKFFVCWWWKDIDLGEITSEKRPQAGNTSYNWKQYNTKRKSTIGVHKELMGAHGSMREALTVHRNLKGRWDVKDERHFAREEDETNMHSRQREQEWEMWMIYWQRFFQPNSSQATLGSLSMRTHPWHVCKSPIFIWIEPSQFSCSLMPSISDIWSSSIFDQFFIPCYPPGDVWSLWPVLNKNPIRSA